MKLKPKEQTVILLALVLLVVFLIYSYIFNPIFNQYTKLYEQENLYKSKIESNIDIIKNSEIITNNYKIIFEKYKITGYDEEELLKTKQEIEEISRSRRLTITKIQDYPVKDMPDYKQFQFQVECNGTLDQITSFIYYLGRSPMLFDISRLKIQPVGTQSDDLRANITISRIGFPDRNASASLEQKEGMPDGA
ncbi:MAG: hypothetical protein JW928_01445 [Candidatus Aureabacteria bacterium]|nr:hypothetical protein [Candidatus Auribacterota bacterium]